LEEADRAALESKSTLERTMKEKKDRFDRATIIKADYGAKITAMTARVDAITDPTEKAAE